MRAFLITLALALPLSLAACADSPQEEAYEEGAPPGDREDVIGDGEIFDEPGEPEGNAFLDADTDGDGMISGDEFSAIWVDGDITAYDTDGDGMVSEAELNAYIEAHPDM